MVEVEPWGDGDAWRAAWQERLEQRPSLYVVGNQGGWVAGLRRVVSGDLVQVIGVADLADADFESSRPIAIAWLVTQADFTQRLEDLHRWRRRKAATLQFGLLDREIEPFGWAVLDAGAQHVVGRKDSFQIMRRVLQRFWSREGSEPRDLLELVQRQLPLRLD